MKVSDDIENICSKCGVVRHVIVAIDKGKIAKVECKQCGSRHRNRLPEHLKPRSSSPQRPGVRKVRRATPTGPEVEPDFDRPIRSYRIQESYEVGDRVEHASFGVGVVERVLGPSKIQVFFPAGQRKLAQGKGG